jgi:hypothetical protein
MSFYEIETPRTLLAAAHHPRPMLSASAAVVLSALFLAGCSSSHPNAAPPSSAPGSVASSGSAAPLSSAPGSAGPVVSSPAASLPPPVSSAVPGAAPVANIEAPATKAGFQIRLHRASILKVDPQQAKTGSTIAFALVPAGSNVLTPVSGFVGYFTGSSDGVVNVTVTQDGAAIGTLSVTVWG